MRSSTRYQALLSFVALVSSVAASATASDQHFPTMVQAASAAAQQDERAELVDELILEWTDADSPGAAVAVVCEGEVVLAKGYGLANLEHRAPVSATTAFNFGSVAKQVTALAVAVLVEEGRLGLDERIRKYLPEMHACAEPITIRHLLWHTSGLRDEFHLLSIAGYYWDDFLPGRFILKLLFGQEELNFPPGQRWLYSNSGYTLLAEIVARVTGKPFTQWVRENVFQPLGMSSTSYFENHEIVIRDRADSYIYAGEGSYLRDEVNHCSVGCGNLMSTVEDMAKWALNFESGLVGGRAALESMDQVGRLDDGSSTGYAFGQFIRQYRGLQVVDHTGAVAGYRTYLIRFPEQRLAVVLACNADYFDVVGIGRRVAEIYLSDQMQPEAAEQQPQEPEPDRRAIEMTAAALARYEGDFKLESGRLVNVSLEEGKLLFSGISAEPFELQPASRERFFAAEFGPQFYFELDGEGIAQAVSLRRGQRVIFRAERVLIPVLTAQQLSELEGRYYSEELQASYTMVVADSQLIAKHARYPDTALTPSGQDTFAGANRWLRALSIERDGQGRVTGFRVSMTGALLVLFTKTDCTQR